MSGLLAHVALRGPKSPAELLASYLRHEEALLSAALPLVRSLHGAFTDAGQTPWAADLNRQQEFVKSAAEINTRRRGLLDELASRWNISPNDMTLERALTQLAEPDRVECAAAAARVRGLAREVAEANHAVAIHLRIHMSAYRRVLRELTNTSAGSGRYGPAGKTESQEYRPLLHIHG